MVRNMTGYRDLARNHDFTVLWIGQTVSELGSRVSMFVFPLLAYQLTGSALAAAAAEALHLLGLVGTLLPAGVLADRMDRRRIMRAASGAGVLLYGSLAVAGIADALTLPHLMVVALLTGAGAGAFAPAETSAVRTVVPTEDLPTALSQQQARQHVATLLGAPLGGLLYGVTRWLPFAADAVSYALSFVLLGRIRTDLSAPTSTGPRRRARQDIAEGMRYTWSRPFFRVLLIWAPLTNLVINALFFVAILRLIQGGFHPVQIGLVETVAGRLGHPRRARRPRDHRALRHRLADDRRRLELPAAAGPARDVEPAAGRRRRARARPVPQPGRQRRHRVLPDRGHPRRAAGPHPVDDAVRLDVRDAALPRPRRRPAQRARRRAGDGRARRAHRPRGADPHAEPLRAGGPAARRLGVRRGAGPAAPARAPEPAPAG